MSRLNEFFKDTQSVVRTAINEELSFQRAETLAALDLYMDELVKLIPDDFNPKDYNDNNVSNELVDKSKNIDNIEKGVEQLSEDVKSVKDGSDEIISIVGDINKAVTNNNAQEKAPVTSDVSTPVTENQDEEKDSEDKENVSEDKENVSDDEESRKEENKKVSAENKIVDALGGVGRNIKVGNNKLVGAYHKVTSTLSGFFNKWWNWIPELFLLINLAILYLRKVWYEIKAKLDVSMDKAHQWLNRKLDNSLFRAVGLAPSQKKDKEELTDEEYVRKWGLSKDGTKTYDQYLEEFKQEQRKYKQAKINEQRIKEGKPLVDENFRSIPGSEVKETKSVAQQTAQIVRTNTTVQQAAPSVTPPNEEAQVQENMSVPSTDISEPPTVDGGVGVFAQNNSSVVVNNTSINVYPKDSFIDYV